MGSSRKNVVLVSGYYEDRRENISTQQQRANKLGLTPVPPPKMVNQTDKENSNMEQLKDIDDDLGIYEDPLNLAHATIAKTRKKKSPSFDLGMLRNDLDASQSMSCAPTLVPPLHQNHATPLHDISNNLQVSDTPDGTAQDKWKRYSHHR
nr:hypothetical protein CFP56_26167 [Quercus suber]